MRLLVIVLLAAASACDPPVPKASHIELEIEPDTSVLPTEGEAPEAIGGASAQATAADHTTSFAVVAQAQPAQQAPPLGGFGAAASRCLEDPDCAMPRYASLALAAVDAGDRGPPCLALMRGIGVPVDAARARACLEREVPREAGCGGSSPSLERLQLAILRGTEGSVEDGMAVLDGCFADATVQATADALRAYEEQGRWPRPSLQICDAELAQTTLHMVQCLQLERDELEVRGYALDKAIATRWGRGMAERHRAVRRAHADYVRDAAIVVGERFGGGSMQPIQVAAAEIGLTTRRLERWEALVRGARLDAPVSEAARSELLAARRRALEEEPPSTFLGAWTNATWQARIRDNERAYAPYRAKELAFASALGRRDELEPLVDAERTDTLVRFGPI